MTVIAAPAVDARPLAVDRPAPSRTLELSLAALPLTLALVVARPLADPDLWWHLRTGELIAERGLVGSDSWSFASSRPWVLHEWLSELVMFHVHVAFGNSGVVALQALLVAGLVAVLLWSCRRVASQFTATLVVCLAVVASLPGLGPRPQLVSWILLAACCPYMRRCIEARRLPWGLLPLIWVWANLHGLWSTVLVLLGALVIGMAIEEGLAGWRTTARFCTFGLGALAAAATTPSGPALLLAPLHVREYARFVSEWATPSIATPRTASALLLVALVVVDWARRGARVPPSTITFVAASAVLGLLYSRTVPVLAIAVAPLAAAALQRLTRRDAPRLRLGRPEAVAWAVALIVAVPMIAQAARAATPPDPARFIPSTTSAAVLAATTHLNSRPGSVRVLNEYALGGWLLWAARNTSPAIDGRTEIYSVNYVERYGRALAMRPGWRQFVQDLDADAALLLDQTPLVEGLQSLGWRVVFAQDALLVLVPPGVPS